VDARLARTLFWFGDHQGAARFAAAAVDSLNRWSAVKASRSFSLDGGKVSMLRELEAICLLAQHSTDDTTSKSAVDTVRQALLSLVKNRGPDASRLNLGLLHVIACQAAGESEIVTRFSAAFPHLKHASAMPRRSP
jgi:hypothetical protein